eukprot:s549_g14.t1
MREPKLPKVSWDVLEPDDLPIWPGFQTSLDVRFFPSYLAIFPRATADEIPWPRGQQVVMVVEPFRPQSPQTQWQGNTLDELARASKRASRFPEKCGRLPTPAYKKRNAPTTDYRDASFATIDEEDSDSESSFGEYSGDEDAEPVPAPPRTRRLSKFSRYSVDETDALKKKAQSMLPDLNLVLEQLRSGDGGLSQSEIERYGASFVRFKDPDGPEMHKDELPNLLAFLGFPNPDPQKCRELADECADYETLERVDFLEFMEKWIAHECERYREIFSSYDDDGSGFLDTTELMTFVSSLGFTPLRSMVKEALDLVDLDRNGLLDFEEVVLLMHCYRHTEGFTLDELQTITAIYQDVVDQVSFRYGVPIELIVFGLLFAGYKAPKWCKGKAKGDDPPVQAEVASKDTAAEKAFWRPWKARRRDEPEKAKSGKGEAKVAKPKSGAALLKKNASQTQWRSIINKFTPEKFEKLCEQLLATLPKQGPNTAEKTTCCDTEFSKILEELLSMIFDACSRQHQYTEMYADLCQKLLDHVAKQRPNLDGRACVWSRCQHIFQTSVLKPPEIPADLPEDEYMDRKAKIKEKMVGMVKFGGDLVGRGLVPAEGVMTWIHTLLSEKTQTEEISDENGSTAEKDVEKREIQNVFEQLERLAKDAKHLSLRIRCLIRDVLDLRIAEWKEKAGKLKPTALQRQKEEIERVETNLRSEAPEFVPGSGLSGAGKPWTSDRLLEGKPWMDPQLLASLQMVDHHLEVIEDRDAKLQRLKALVQVYHLIQEKQIVVVANTINLRRILDMISHSFGGTDYRCLDQNTPEHIRTQSLRSFEIGQASMLLMTTDVCARRDFDFGRAAPVLINFDFPMTLQLYLYRIQKRTDSETHVYTFFSPHDVRHAASLVMVLEGARQKVPDALKKMKEQVKADPGKNPKEGRRKNGGDEEDGNKTNKRHDRNDDRGSRQERRREGTNLLPAEMLGDVLVQFFGPAQAQKARDLQSECIARMSKMTSTASEGGAVAGMGQKKTTFGMGFHEVLLWARRLREKEFESYRDAFQKFDEDGSDSIDMGELQNVIKTLGYTMTKATIMEIKQKAFKRTDLDDMCARTSSEVLDSDSMDYDSFVHFMMMLQQSDGFSAAEVQEIKETFRKFDEDGSGDIDVCELSDMLRFQGHAASIDEVRRLHSRVDFNGSGALDVAEFIRFMRLYREEMLESVRQAFDTLKDTSSGLLNPERLPLAINQLEFAREERRIDVDPFLPHVPLEFDSFINLCDKVREAQVAVDRKRAGFSEARRDREIEHYWALYASYDTKKSGTVSMEECTNLLATLGFQVRTVEEQQDLKQLLQQARNVAQAAGVDVRDGGVNFYVLLQLLQALFVNHERETEQELVQVADETGFTMSEVSEFNDVFVQYWNAELEPGEWNHPSDRLRKKTITRSSVYKLLRSMGIRLDHSSKTQIDHQIHKFSGEKLDFHGCLRLMRWIVDVNFASINST